MTTETIEEEKKKPGRPPAQPTEKQVLIDKSELTTILDRLNKLEQGEQAQVLTEIKNHTATVRVINDKVVTELGEVIADKMDKDVLTMDVTLEDGEVINFNYLEFIHKGNKVDVKILETFTKNTVRKDGYVTIKAVEGYEMVNTGVKVPVEVIVPLVTAKIQMPDGRTLTVSNNILNI